MDPRGDGLYGDHRGKVRGIFVSDPKWYQVGECSVGAEQKEVTWKSVLKRDINKASQSFSFVFDSWDMDQQLLNPLFSDQEAKQFAGQLFNGLE